MGAANALADGVRVLLEEAADLLPVRGLGIVEEDAPEHAIFTYVDGFGATAYRCRLEGIPERLRPRDASRTVTPIDLDANPTGLVETRILHPGHSEDIRREFVVYQTVAVAVPDPACAATFLVAISEPGALTGDQISAIGRLAARVIDFLRRVESPDEERE